MEKINKLRDQYKYSQNDWSVLCRAAEEALKEKNQNFSFESPLLKIFLERITSFRKPSNNEVPRKRCRKLNSGSKREERLVLLRNKKKKHQMKEIARATQRKYEKLFLKRKLNLEENLPQFAVEGSMVI